MHTVSDDLSRRWHWRQSVESWLDGIEPGWAIPALLAGFVAVWMVFFSIAYINAGLHPDVLEAWSVGRGFPWGNAKHPPLMGWITNAWSMVFPLTDWSFNLLAMVNAAFALWSVDLIVRRFVRGDRRVIVLLLLMLLPAYQFHAQRFNANSVLLAVWPLATFCFLRSFETRATGWSIATGVLCALAMLGKYYSVFLITGFAFAAIVHPRRMLYLRSRAPWLSIFAGFVAISPHLYWLATNGRAPFEYAMQVHGGEPFWMTVQDVGGFWIGLCGYLAIPALVWLLMIKFRLKECVRDIGQADSGLKLLAMIFLGSTIFPSITALVLGTNLPPLWHLQGLFMVVIVVVCSIRFPIARFDTVNLAVTIVIFCMGALIAAPLHALYRNKEKFKEGRNFYHQASEILTKNWKDAYGVPLPRISGDDGLAFATAFYSPDHPFYSRPFQRQGQWGLPRNITLDRGWTALCFADDVVCMRWMDSVSDRTERETRFEFVVETSLWGVQGVSGKIAAMMVPPVKSDDPAGPARKINNDGGMEYFSASRKRYRSSLLHRAENDGLFVPRRVVHLAETP